MTMFKRIKKFLEKERDRTPEWKKTIFPEIQDATLSPWVAGYQGPVEIGRVAFSIRNEKPHKGITLWYKWRNKKVKTTATDVVIHYDSNHFNENHSITGNVLPNIPPFQDDLGIFDMGNDCIQGECGRPYDSQSPNLHEENDAGIGQLAFDSGEPFTTSLETKKTDRNDGSLLHVELCGAVPNKDCTIFSEVPELPLNMQYTNHTGRHVMYFDKQNDDSLGESADIPITHPKGVGDFYLPSGNLCILPLASCNTRNACSNGEPTAFSLRQNLTCSVGTLDCLDSVDKITSSVETQTSHLVELSVVPFDTKDEHQNVSEASYIPNTRHAEEQMVSVNKESTKCVNQLVSEIYGPSKELKIQSIDDKIVSVEECQVSCYVQTISSDKDHEASAPKSPLFCKEIGASDIPNTRSVKGCKEHIACSKVAFITPSNETNYPFSIVKKNKTPMAKVKPRVRSNKSNLLLEEVPLPKVLDFSSLLIELYPLEKILFENNFVSYSSYESSFSLLFANPEISFANRSRTDFSMAKKKDCENSTKLTIADGFQLSHLVIKDLKQDNDMNSSQGFKQIREKRICLTEGRKNAEGYNNNCSNQMSGEIIFKKKLFSEANDKMDMPIFHHSSSHSESNDGAVTISLFVEQQVTTTSDSIIKKVAGNETLNRDGTFKLPNNVTNDPLCRNGNDKGDYEENSSVITSEKQVNEPTSVSVTQQVNRSTEVMTNKTDERKPLQISLSSCNRDNMCTVFNDEIDHPPCGEGDDLLERHCTGYDLHMLELSIVSDNPTCLYNYEGEICTIKKARYIEAYLPKCGKLVHVNIKRKEMFGSKVGCQILWDGQTPIPLFDVEDGSKVKFDAIFLEENNSFQALVMWKNVKPNSIIEPSNRSYTLIYTKKAVFKKLYILDGKKYAQVYMERTKIMAEILRGAVFVNGKHSDFASLFSSMGTIFCRVSKLMLGRQGGYYVYICSCIWSGCLPPEFEVPITFKMGHIYRLDHKGTFISDLNPLCMYCDLSGLLKGTLENCALEFIMENNAITMTESIEDLHFGHYKIKRAGVPYVLPVKAHVLRVSGSQWHVILLQLSDNEIPDEILSKLIEPKPDLRSFNREGHDCDSQQVEDPLQRRESFTQMSLAEDIEASYMISPCKDNNKAPKIEKSVGEISEKYRQMSSKNIHDFLQTLVTGAEATAITELDGDSKKQNEIKAEISAVSKGTCKKSGKDQGQYTKDEVTMKEQEVLHGKDGAPGRRMSCNPRVIEDATGFLTSVVGDYGLLKLNNKQLTGQVMAVFHKSVAYINRWPLYKDLLFCEQIENLSSNTWHCSLEQSRGHVGGMEVDYKATLAWQGFKPTKSDVHYFKNLPSDNPFWYSSYYRKDGNLETLVFYNGIYKESYPQDLQPQLSPETDDTEGDLSDFINLFPTLTPDCEVEVVDAPIVTSMYTRAFQRGLEFDFGLNELFQPSSTSSTDAMTLISSLELFSPGFLRRLP